jgi:hypothetical protein
MPGEMIDRILQMMVVKCLESLAGFAPSIGGCFPCVSVFIGFLQPEALGVDVLSTRSAQPEYWHKQGLRLRAG